MFVTPHHVKQRLGCHRNVLISAAEFVRSLYVMPKASWCSARRLRRVPTVTSQSTRKEPRCDAPETDSVIHHGKRVVLGYLFMLCMRLYRCACPAMLEVVAA